MILPDSSAWIEYLRGTGSPAHRRLVSAIESGEELATTGPVLMEILAGARDEQHAHELTRLIGSAKQLLIEQPSDFEAAAAIYRSCRSAGRTVGSLADCLIAAVAIREQTAVLHDDADFEAIAAVAPLAAVPADPPQPSG